MVGLSWICRVQSEGQNFEQGPGLRVQAAWFSSLPLVQCGLRQPPPQCPSLLIFNIGDFSLASVLWRLDVTYAEHQAQACSRPTGISNAGHTAFLVIFIFTTVFLAVWFCFSFSYSEKEHFSGSNVTCRYSENQCLVYMLLVLYSL